MDEAEISAGSDKLLPDFSMEVDDSAKEGDLINCTSFNFHPEVNIIQSGDPSAYS